MTQLIQMTQMPQIDWAQLAQKNKKYAMHSHREDECEASSSSWPGVQALLDKLKIFFWYRMWHQCFSTIMKAHSWHVKPSCKLRCATSHLTRTCSPSAATCSSLALTNTQFQTTKLSFRNQFTQFKPLLVLTQFQTCCPSCEPNISTRRPDTWAWSCGSWRPWHCGS